MKIKKVEIQAFKSYLYKNDGTFDFTVNSDVGGGHAADFVSIYAPNGFGKTSFYDAVDFALTHNITRYIRNTKLSSRHKQDVTNLDKEGVKQHLLRNRDADALEFKLNTEVIVFTNKNDNPFVSPEIKVRNGNRDFQFDDSKTERRYFREVMLTQEMIDVFLRETSPDERYKKFSESPTGELQQIESQRKKLSRMSQDVLDIQNKLQKDGRLQRAELLKIDASEAPFDVANQLIDKLREDTVIIDNFHSPYLEVDNSKTKDQINSAKNQLSKKNLEIEKDAASLHNFVVNIDSSQRQTIKLESSNSELGKIIVTLKKNDSIEKLEQENENNSRILSDKSNELNQLRAYQKQVADFLIHYNLMDDLTKKVSKEQKYMDQIIQEHKVHETNIQLLFDKKIQLEKELKEYEGNRQGFSDWFREIDTLQTETLHLEARVKEIEIGSSTLEKEETLINRVSELLKSYTIDRVIVEPQLNAQIQPLNQFYNEYREKCKQRESSQSELTKLEFELKKIQLQSKSIAELISIASQIIADTKQSDCPLCQQPYADFEQLKKNIYENPALSQREQVIYQKIQNFQLRETEYTNDLYSLQTQYKELQQGLIDEEKQKLSINIDKQLNLQREKTDITSFIDLKHTTRIGLVEKTGHKTITEYNADIEEKVTSLEKSLAQLAVDLDRLERLFGDATNKLQSFERDIARLISDLELVKIKVKQFSLYTLYLEKFINLVVEEEAIHTMLLTSIGNSDAEILRLENTRIENYSQIKDLQSTIPNEARTFSRAQLKQQEIDLEAATSQLNNSLQDFNAVLIKLGSPQPRDSKGWEDLRQSTQTEIEKLQYQIQNHERLLSDLLLLSQFSEQAVNFCQRLDIVTKIENIEANIERHKKIYNDLSWDLVKTNDFIQKTADSYFETELINQIYSAIDPHPEYKRIEFECYIPEDGKPQLNITAVSSNNDVVIPNINFSSAQINVLSLSIFLARALTTTDDEDKPIDCIFIDDPIQSMDSINILSLIDLFRNLSSRFGKQLIISTHDENFHELLKKKIPPQIFNSKYLRLTSFGKVAYD